MLSNYTITTNRTGLKSPAKAMMASHSDSQFIGIKKQPTELHRQRTRLTTAGLKYLMVTTDVLEREKVLSSATCATMVPTNIESTMETIKLNKL